MLLVDDHEIVRDGVRARLHGSRFSIVGECGTVVDALAAVAELKLDLVIVDQRLPDGEGLEIASSLADYPDLRMLLLSAILSPTLVQRGLELGVHGFVSKDSFGEVLLQALNAVAINQRFVDPTMVSELLTPRDNQLTSREHEVLRLMADGLANKEIAWELDISPETVKIHVTSLLRKIGAANRTDAVAIALRKMMLP